MSGASARKPIPGRLRFATLHRFGFKCAYCGAPASQAELVVDHLHPVAGGGQNDEHNLVAACVECNTGKADLLISNLPDLAALGSVGRMAAVRDIRPSVQDHGLWEREEAVAASLLRFIGAEILQ